MLELSEQTPVQLQMTTHIEQDGNVSEYQFTEVGKLAQLGPNVYLRYQEHATQQDQPTVVPVTLKLQADGQTILTRGKGDWRSQLYFDPKRLTRTRYQTAYGPITIDTKTTMLKTQLQTEPLHGEVAIDYELLTGQRSLGNYQMRLIFNE